MDFLVTGATTCFLLAGVLVFLGVAILRDAGRERLHRVTALMLFFGGLGAFLAGLSLAARASTPQGATAFTELALSFASAWEFFFPALLLFTLLFPTELPALKRIGWIQELIFVPYVFHLVLKVVADASGGDFFIPDLAKQVPWASALLTPLRVGLSLIYSAHTVLFSFVNLGYVALTLTILGARQRKVHNPRLRAQMRVVLRGLTVCLVFYSLAVPVPVILGLDWQRVTPALLVIGLAAGAGSIAYSIVRHRFLDTRLFLRRSLFFVVTAGALSALALAVFRPIERFLQGFSQIDVTLLEPLFLMLALVMLQPLVSRVEEIADRWVRRDRREGRAVLEHLSRDIVTLMDLPALGDRLARAVFESMACDGVGLVARRPRGDGFHLVAGAGFVHVSPEMWGALATDLSVLDGCETPVPLRQALLQEQSRESGEWARTAAEFPVEVLVPLRHGGELLGALVLGPKGTRTRYQREDLLLLELLGHQTAAAIRNSHLLSESLERAAMEEELHLAQQIQSSYLPSRFPQLEQAQLWGTNVPSKQVGGDYYDYVEEPGGLLLVVADVVGKGVPAALLMSMLQASLRTLASEGRSLADIVTYLNQLILRSGIEGKFATCFLARLDLDSLTLSYTNAGHNPPCLVRAGGEVEWLRQGGLLLGVFEDSGVAQAEVQLEPGDRLVLYTDGITEAANERGEFFAEEGLVSVLRRLPPDLDAEAVSGEVFRSVREFCGGLEPADDMTVLVLRIPQPAGVPV
jgi:serine phosphatase RsbU (regulator of sigma subunit)